MAGTVIPVAATVAQGNTGRFVLPVIWSIEPPDGGSIDSAGLYQAPVAVAANLDVAVIAKDANGREIGRARVSLVAGAAPPAPAGQVAAGVVRPVSVPLGAGQPQQFS